MPIGTVVIQGLFTAAQIAAGVHVEIPQYGKDGIQKCRIHFPVFLDGLGKRFPGADYLPGGIVVLTGLHVLVLPGYGIQCGLQQQQIPRGGCCIGKAGGDLHPVFHWLDEYGKSPIGAEIHPGVLVQEQSGQFVH